jgi:predicted dehydrogenase
MPSSAVHFLLVGGSHPHSRAHLRTLQVLPEVAAVTVAEEDDAVRTEYAAQPKVVAALPSLDAALRTDATHAFVCVPNTASPNTICRCAAAGRHIIAEKPLAVSARAFAPAAAAVRDAGVVFSVMYQARLHPFSVEARWLIQAGVLGRPIAAEARMVTSQVRHRDPGHWLFRRDVAGGGILSWLGCHYVDLLAYLLGDEYASVAAHVGTLGGEAVDVEDVAALSLRFAAGTLATLTAGYLLALSPAGYAQGAYDTHIGVYGTDGRLWWDPVGGRTLHVESRQAGWMSAPRREYTFGVAESPAYGGVYGEEFLRRFLAASRGQGDAPTGLQDGMRVLRVLDAVYESAERGVRVEICD